MANEAALPPVEILPEDKKGDIRIKVWTYLQKNKLASFPFPPFRRIPNFVTSQETCAKITEFPEFLAAKCIKIDPDKPLQEARYQILKAGKTLLVPTPRLIHNFLNEITPPQDGDDEILKTCASQKGVLNYSKSLDLETHMKVDLVIVGAVAITASGWRIGKGAGYSDLEYAMMLTLGMVTPNTKIVAVVHDCQVLDIPQSLFEAHDVPVDIIVTPTRIINCVQVANASRNRPSSIFWNILDEDRLKTIPILRSIRYLEWKNGKTVALKDEVSNPGDLQPENMVELMQEADEARKKSLENNGRRNRSFGQRRERGRGNRPKEPRSKENANEKEEKSEKKEDRAPRRGRGGRRFFGQPRRRTDSSKKDDIKENGLGGGDAIDGKRSERSRQDDRPTKDGTDGKGRERFKKWGRYRLKGKLFVGKIPRFVRVSEFKNEVREAAKSTEAFLVRVDWFGSNGFAFLNYETAKEAEAVLAALEGLTIKDKPIFVEMARERKRTRSGSSKRKESDEMKEAEAEAPKEVI